jgi:PAS domain S-box-containing protein
MFASPSVRRLLLEVVSVVAGVEAAALMFMPMVLPEAFGWRAAAVHATVLVGLVVPFALWRRRRLLGGGARVGDRWGTVVGLGILLTGVPSALWISGVMARGIERTAAGDFESEMREVVQQVRSISSRPVYGLKGVKGLYAASVDVSRQEFGDFVASQTASGVFPGVRVIGFAARVTPEEVERFVERQRADGVADFAVSSSAHPYALRWVVQYAEAKDNAPMMLGFDLGSIPAAQDAFERAVTSGKPALSHAFAMPGNAERVDTLLWAVPISLNGQASGTPEERWKSNLGTVFCTFSFEGLEPVVSEALGGKARLDLLEGGLASEGGRLMLSTGTAAAVHARELSESIELGGVRWAVILRSTSMFEASIDRVTPGVVAASGVAVAVLASGFVLNLGRSREEAIRLAEKMTGEVRRLSVVAERTSNAVIITDADQHITWVNDGFTRITGYTREEVVGQRPGDLLQCENTDPETRGKIRESLRQGKGFRGEIVNRSKFGREYWLDIDIQPVLDGTGRATAYIAVESDLTNQKSFERELLDAKSTAEAANDAKGRFLAGMSHEIRTPLNGIIGFADLLRRGADEGDPARRAEWVGVIHSSGCHLLRLLNDVLDLSKLDADKMDISVAPCDPMSVITESVALLKSRAVEKGIGLEVIGETDVPRAIRSDSTRIRQVMMNLVSNAVKFTPEGGVTVHVSTAQGGGGVPVLRVDVHDTGIGMSPEQLAQVFRPYQQADKTITQKFGGTGLGLVLARQIVQRLGGDITVTSRQGRGQRVLGGDPRHAAGGGRARRRVSGRSFAAR